MTAEAPADVARSGDGWRQGQPSDIVGIPTSNATCDLAREPGAPLTDFSANPRIDLTIDGADEVTPTGDLIKGLGGALLREKIVAVNSRRLVIVVEESKLVQRLGQRAPSSDRGGALRMDHAPQLSPRARRRTRAASWGSGS